MLIFLLFLSFSWAGDSWYLLPSFSSTQKYSLNVFPLPKFSNKQVRIGVVDGNISYDALKEYPQLKLFRKAIFSKAPFKSDGHAEEVLRVLINSSGQNSNLEVYHCAVDKQDLNFSIDACFQWLVKNSVEAVNVSIDFNFISEKEHLLFKKMEFLKIPIIKSAGNESNEASGLCAMYKNVYCIGALDFMGKRADYSNYGSLVFSWELGESMTGKKGTSFSAPSFLGKLIKKP